MSDAPARRTLSLPGQPTAATPKRKPTQTNRQPGPGRQGANKPRSATAPAPRKAAGNVWRAAGSAPAAANAQRQPRQPERNAPAARPDARMANAKPNAKPNAHRTAHTGARPGTRSDTTTRAGARPQARPAPRPDVRPGTHVRAKANAQPDARPDTAQPSRSRSAQTSARPATHKASLKSRPTTRAPSTSAPTQAQRRPAPTSRPATSPAPQQAAAPANAANAVNGTRLNKYLADAQCCSRREADAWIERGWVRINGQVAHMGQRVQPGDQVEVAPAARRHQAQQLSIALHKPVGYVSGQAEDGYLPALSLITDANHWEQDPQHRQRAPRSLKGFAPAGRLDIDSTGLLILTQDGRMARHIIGEHSTVDKEYLVRVRCIGTDGQSIDSNVQAHVPEAALQRLRHGLELDGVALQPAQVEWQNPEQLRFVLREGRKRQIRRMCEQVGLHVSALKRVRIGRLTLGQLPPGQWRYLGQDELV
ncbi:pseudouridine synthase [Vandammella animalimorsus]|uniref:pseudouridine synthase n=1 Tax=Vandammella animalimorsus TaxID=2029117 RepID=UPI0031BB8146